MIASGGCARRLRRCRRFRAAHCSRFARSERRAADNESPRPSGRGLPSPL